MSKRKPISKITLGNPLLDSNQEGNTLSKKGSPITLRIEGNTVKSSIIDFDLEGNLLIHGIKGMLLEGKNLEILIEESSSLNMTKEDIILACLKFLLKANDMIFDITKDLSLNSKNITLTSETTKILSPLVEIGFPNDDILKLVGEDYDLNKGYDFVVTRNKLIKMLVTLFKPFIEEYQSFISKYNNHTNAGNPLDAIHKFEDISKSNNAKTYDSLEASKTLKVL